MTALAQSLSNEGPLGKHGESSPIDWLELAIDERNRRYYREQFLHQTFIGDCWRGKEDLADRPSICGWAMPCATEAEQHEPLKGAA